MQKDHKKKGLRTWLEIDSSAVEHNIQEFKKFLPQDVALMAVVKSNAYGHGLVHFTRELSKQGIMRFAVDSIVEAERIRAEKIHAEMILVLGYTLPEKYSTAAEHDISITVSTRENLEYAVALYKKTGHMPALHIKVDSGMHRQGFLIDDLDFVVDFILKNKDFLDIQGLYTHFAAAKNPMQPEATHEQINVFNQWIAAFKKANIDVIVHAAATGAALLYPDSYYDMVRIGIGFYGLWPSVESEAYMHMKVNLKPTLTWKTIIAEIKKLTKDSKIGYDFTHTLNRDSVVAVCPIGYWHGFPRSLSNNGFVLVHGMRAKVIGRVSMDMIVIDITDIEKVVVGSEVVLIGASGDNYISVHDVASLAGVSSYELITRLNPLLEKIYV